MSENKRPTTRSTKKRTTKAKADTAEGVSVEETATPSVEAVEASLEESAPVSPAPFPNLAPVPAEPSAPQAVAAAPAPAESGPVARPSEGSGVKFRLSDEYMIQTHFDKASRQFIASVAEFPEIRVSANSRDAAVLELEDKLESHVENLRRRGEQLSEPISSRRYPEKLELKLSQGLFRRLDHLSRHEKVSLEQLVVELLASAVERRLEPLRQPTSRPQSNAPHGHAPQGGRHQHHGQPDNAGNRRQGGSQQQHGNRRDQAQRSREVMESRESFMEYVRNLEKGGGGWKKR